MPEIPNVVSGEPVEADWGNDIRDRSVQKYADLTALQFSQPLPQLGELAWLDDPGYLVVCTDTAPPATWTPVLDRDQADGRWVNLDGDTMTGTLNLPEVIATDLVRGPLFAQAVEPPDATGVTTSSVEVYETGVLPATTGSWLVQFVVGRFSYPTDTVDVTMTAILNTSGINRTSAVQVAVAGSSLNVNLAMMGTFPGGANVSCRVVSGSNTNKNARDMFVTVTEVATPAAFPA